MRKQHWIGAGAALLLFPVGCYSGVDPARASGALSGAGGTDTSASGGETEGSDAGDDGGVDGAYEPSPVALRRLLASQYTESVRLLLGTAAADVADPPTDAALNGLTSIGASQLALGSAEVDRYEASARAISAAAVAAGGTLPYLTCAPTAPDDAACMNTFTANFGRFAFRHTLEDDERSRYADVGITAAIAAQSFDAGIEAMVAAMLQSPFFLYQVETGEPDPDSPGQRRLVGTELATRMSFFLTGTTPDVTLLDAAESGFLEEPGGVRSAAQALVDRTEARLALTGFTAEVLGLKSLATLPKDAGTFPTYDTELAAAMHEETLQLIEHVAFDLDGDFSEVLDADYTFVNDVLAAHYGIPGEFGPEFQQVTLPADQRRGGILGHAGVLAVHAHVSSTSPTLRGKFVRETLLCQVIPAPPPEVVTDLPVGDGTETMRERLEYHMTEPACAGCHVLMDPIGFALESYDGVGAFRTLDNGKPIDDSAELDGVAVAGAAELGSALRDNPNTHACTVLNLYRHATGHLESASEDEVLREVADAYADSGYRLKAALIELAASPAFRIVGEPIQ